ncbi:MAG TPA: VOC family protein [Myxococcota bacterium]
MKQKITPHLWFDDDAEAAIALYTSIFPDSRLVEKRTLDNTGPDRTQSVETFVFELAGQRSMAINGGKAPFHFNDAISLYVEVDDQAELDRVWNALVTDGGKPQQCGWITDRFGLVWQVVPDILDPLLADPDTAKADRVMQAMLSMVKLDFAGLQAAAAG